MIKTTKSLNNKKGAPVATLSPKALHYLEKKFKTKKIRILLSLTDEKDYAMAFAILEKEESKKSLDLRKKTG